MTASTSPKRLSIVVSENTQFVGVTYHDCYHVDGYVCTDPV